MLSTIKRLEMRVQESEDSSAASRSTIKRLEMRVKELENKLDKGATDATPSVADPNAAKEDVVKEETVKPVADRDNHRSWRWGPSERSCATAGFELDQGRLQDHTFRGAQA